MRSASAGVCAPTTLIALVAGMIKPDNFCALRNDLGDKRALTNATGTLRCWHVWIRFGQTSVSIKTQICGLKWRKKRRHKKGMSYGKKACSTSLLTNKALPVARPVGVMCVSKIR